MAIQTLFYLSTQRKAYHASNGLPLKGPWYPWSVRPLHTKYTELQWFPVIIGTPHIPEWTLLDEVLFKCGEVTLSARLVSSLYHSLDQIVTTQHTHTHTHTTQQHNSTTAQQYNSTTTQQHNSPTNARTHTHAFAVRTRQVHEITQHPERRKKGCCRKLLVSGPQRARDFTSRPTV